MTTQLMAVLPEPEMAMRMQFAARAAARLLECARITGDYPAFDLGDRILLILTSGQSFFDANRSQLLRDIDDDPQGIRLEAAAGESKEI